MSSPPKKYAVVVWTDDNQGIRHVKVYVGEYSYDLTITLNLIEQCAMDRQSLAKYLGHMLASSVADDIALSVEEGILRYDAPKPKMQNSFDGKTYWNHSGKAPYRVPNLEQTSWLTPQNDSDVRGLYETLGMSDWGKPPAPSAPVKPSEPLCCPVCDEAVSSDVDEVMKHVRASHSVSAKILKSWADAKRLEQSTKAASSLLKNVTLS